MLAHRLINILSFSCVLGPVHQIQAQEQGDGKSHSTRNMHHTSSISASGQCQFSLRNASNDDVCRIQCPRCFDCIFVGTKVRRIILKLRYAIFHHAVL